MLGWSLRLVPRGEHCELNPNFDSCLMGRSFLVSQVIAFVMTGAVDSSSISSKKILRSYDIFLKYNLRMFNNSIFECLEAVTDLDPRRSLSRT
jgi:hypothetical protein